MDVSGAGWHCQVCARLTETHALNGLAASVWDRASKARIGITLTGQNAAGVVVLRHKELPEPDACHALITYFRADDGWHCWIGLSCTQSDDAAAEVYPTGVS